MYLFSCTYVHDYLCVCFTMLVLDVACMHVFRGVFH